MLVAGALLVTLVLLVNIARHGSAIATEVRRAQSDYLDAARGDPLAERHALKLGQCLHRSMLKVARTGFRRGDTWLIAARVQALPKCQQELPARANLLSASAADMPAALTGVSAITPAAHTIRAFR